jgi:RNA polymerase sigma-70 factor (ECF subfamily)
LQKKEIFFVRKNCNLYHPVIDLLLHMNDLELVNQIKKGNANAYRYLVDKHKRLVFNLAWRMGGQNQSDVEDIAQEVFIKVYKNIKQFRKESKLSTWIASIAWKTAVDFVRKKSRNKLNFSDKLEAFESLVPGTYSDLMERKEMKDMVHEIIVRLPLHYQTVLTLYYLEEFSYDEMVEITGMPLGTIKSYLNRAKKFFKCLIEQVHGKEAISFLYNDK